MTDQMKRIIVIGGNGSGKTTFSVALAERLQLPLVHLDRLYWKGNWEHCTKEEFDALLASELEQPLWIIDGNFNRTIPVRLAACDTVFYFDFSTVRCLFGVLSRIIRNHGKCRTDMGGNCPDRFDWQFLHAVVHFNRRNRKRYRRMLGECEGKQVVIFRNRRQVNRYLNALHTKKER